MIWTKKLANMGWNLGLFGEFRPPKIFGGFGNSTIFIIVFYKSV